MRHFTILAAVLLGLALPSCKSGSNSEPDKGNDGASQSDGKKQEEIASKIMDSMSEFAAALKTVNNTQSAKMAAEKIDSIGDRFSEFAGELQALETPTQEFKESIAQKMEGKEAEMQQALRGDFLKTIQALPPGAQKIMQKAFQEFFEKMQDADKEFDRHFKTNS